MKSKEQENYCIIVAINEKYVPFFSVLLESIVDNVDDSGKYEIVVLYSQLEDKNQKMLKVIVNRNNIRIRFLNVTRRIEGQNFFVSGEKQKAYLSKEAYFRLLAPELLPEYQTALYLDSDIVVRAGWTDIFKINLDGYLLAAVPDIWDNWKCLFKHSQLAEYRKKELNIVNNREYFNSGVMLLNLEEMRRVFKNEELLKLAVAKEWKKHDQDVMNMVCKGKVHFLSYKWNLIECPDKEALSAVSQEERRTIWECQENRLIVHFASRKPWLIRGVQNEADFWQYAIKSPYFDSLFSLFVEEQMQQGKYFEQTVFKSIRNGKIGVKFILKCISAWMKKFSV